MLLFQIRGGTSFVDLHSYNGITCNTLKESVVACSILQDDGE